MRLIPVLMRVLYIFLKGLIVMGVTLVLTPVIRLFSDRAADRFADRSVFLVIMMANEMQRLKKVKQL